MLPVSSAAFITCAVTGSGDSTGTSDKVPVTPEQIAASALEAAQAGAAVVHIHVRDPKTGKGARDPQLYAKVVEIIRASSTDVVINLTTGMGGDLVLGGAESPLPPSTGTDMAGATERLVHVAELRPEICTLDCGTMNFAAGGDYIMVNTPGMVREMAQGIQALGVKPEVEIFDTGDLVLLNELVADGLVDDPAMVQLCMGIPYGAPNDPSTLQAMVNNLPAGSVFSAFSIGRFQLPYAAMATLMGGNVRVGLEDNLYLSRGVLATNAQLVSRAVTLLESMNVRIKTAAEVRDTLGLVKHG
ncbi:MAG: 3-keto-5-aminohexanoate cleavage protein [Actinomycetes bacterium]